MTWRHGGLVVDLYVLCVWGVSSYSVCLQHSKDLQSGLLDVFFLLCLDRVQVSNLVAVV